jgi:hypothetical protein
MPDQGRLIGAGILNVPLPGGNRTSPLPFQILEDGIVCYPSGMGGAPARPFDHFTGAAAGDGQALLTALPAAPQDRFPLQWRYDGQQFLVAIAQAGPFGALINADFQELNLSFTEKRAPGSLAAEGALTMRVFEHALPLRPGLRPSAGLVFSLDKARHPGPLPLPPVGELELERLEVSANFERWKNLQALYTFERADAAPDLAGALEGLDLNRKSPANTVSRIEGGIRLERGARLQSGPQANALMERLFAADEFTLEVWAKPKQLEWSGPATLLALSTANGGNFISLGQHPQNGTFIVTGIFTHTPPTRTRPSTETPSQIVFTRDAQGRERLFLNGVEISSRDNPASLRSRAIWQNQNYLLTVGDFLDKNQSWEGELYRVAIHDRALPPDAVERRYFQHIELQGQWRVAEAPAPFDRSFPAEATLFADPAAVVVTHEAPISFAPELEVDQWRLRWEKTGAGPWKLDGEARALIWNNPAPLRAALGGPKNRPLLTLSGPADPPLALSLDGWGLAPFQSLTLAVKRESGKTVWRLEGEAAQPAFALPTPAHRAFDAGVEILLEQPGLSLHDGRLALSGRWLGEAMAFSGHRRAQRLLLRAHSRFALPFSLFLPAPRDPRSGILLGEPISIEDSDMRVELDVELGQNGFLARVGAAFDWSEAASGLTQGIRLPWFALYRPAANKHALLGHIIDELRRQANELFVEQGRHQADYHLGMRQDEPVIHLGPSAVIPREIKAVLPPIFDSASSLVFRSQPALIELRQASGRAELTLRPQGADQANIDQAHEHFWNAIHARADARFLPGGADILRRGLAERLPLRHDRLLYYHYGWNAEHQYLDLQGGMRLKVDFQQYQFAPASESRVQSGFAGGGATYLQVHSYARRRGEGVERLLGFDPFLSLIEAQHIAPLPDEGLGGVSDLMGGGGRRAHYRLFFPRQLGRGDAPGRGALIVGADTVQDLRAATEELLRDGRVSGDVAVSFFFRGRAAVTPQILVFMREQPVFVPLGATLRQLVERHAGLPAPGQDPRAFLGDARPLRLIHEGMDGKPSYVFINLAEERAGDPLDVLDMPVLKGDRFFF